MPPRKRKTAITEPSANSAKAYDHLKVVHPMRPEVGTQPQFKNRKPPRTYRYDSSLSPALDWDTSPAREFGEKLIADILNSTSIEEAKTAAAQLKAISKPFLNWTGKAERLSFDVPTLPLFIHERLSTKAIMETIKNRKRDKQMELDLFADPQHSITDQILKAYEHQDKWVNRMILGDSVTVMNSLLEYENMAGKFQMIYMDPPYGVKFGSNFQPFVRKRDVKHNDDSWMTREPEMVQAYRDTWSLGLHSYLSYLRDRLTVSRALLHQSGTIFVQISDTNLHHLREVLDEVFGEENFLALITLKKLSYVESTHVPSTADYILAYAKDHSVTKYRQLYTSKIGSDDGAERYDQVELPDGTRRPMTAEEKSDPTILPKGARRYQLDNLVAAEYRPDTTVEFEFEGRKFFPGHNSHWKTTVQGLKRLAENRRLQATGGSSLRQVRFLDDFPARAVGNLWTDISGSIQSRTDPKIYVVQTSTAAIRRCMLMATDPGDLVLDPTCGSGTTAYVAEAWGRRWITIDTSRVPLSLARQRLLTATFPYFTLKEESVGPSGGFKYSRKKNAQGEEVGGIVPHVTLRSIANNEPPQEEVLVDRPDEVKKVVRVTGPFVVEATIPVPIDGEATHITDDMRIQGDEPGAFVDKMLEVLRKSPILRIDAKHEIKLKDIRRPTRTLSLSAEAIAVNGKERNIAFIFGPENGSISESLIFSAAKEAHAKNYSQLIALGFAIEPNARLLIDRCEEVVGIKAMYVQATPDLMMGDLLKTMRSSQIFSVCGLPDFKIKKIKSKKDSTALYQVILDGLDTFDATSMEISKLDGGDVPGWFLDTNYNNLVFHVDQAFFPRTGAWENLKKSLKGVYDDDVWTHLAGNKSAVFEAGSHGQVAVKVVDDRGNELVAVRSFKEAE